jgi:hypothetical protein
MNRKATFSDLVTIVFFVAIAFGICMWSKTLVGFLFVVPMLFLLWAIPYVLLNRITCLVKRSRPTSRETTDSASGHG